MSNYRRERIKILIRYIFSSVLITKRKNMHAEMDKNHFIRISIQLFIKNNLIS